MPRLKAIRVPVYCWNQSLSSPPLGYVMYFREEDGTFHGNKIVARATEADTLAWIRQQDRRGAYREGDEA